MPEFKLGFKAFAEAHPGLVGEPLDDERWDSAGNSVQATTKGKLEYIKAANQVQFFPCWPFLGKALGPPG